MSGYKRTIRQFQIWTEFWRTTGQLWDRFSWYALKDPKMMHDIEVLVLRMLPRYLRALTRQEGHFLKAKRYGAADERNVDYITRKAASD
jgi:hypothetical protein